MMYEIKEISIKDVYRLFPNFDKRFKLRDNYIIYCLFIESKPVSCLSFAFEGTNFAKIHACYTPKELRKRGYFKILLSNVLSIQTKRTIKADCLPDSFGIFSECGFEFLEKKYCNGYTLYKTILKR